MYLVFDTETTGLADFSRPPEDPCQPRLVQLGAQLLDADLVVRAEMNMIVRPDGFTIPPDAEKVHGISMAVAERYGFEEITVLQQFALLCERAETLVAHNLQFDGIVMGRAYAIRGVPVTLPPNKRCTKIDMTPVCNLPGGRNGQPKWPTLSQAHIHVTGQDFAGAHDAMADVRACATVLRFLVTGQRSAPTAAAANPANPVKQAPAPPYDNTTRMPFGKWRNTELGNVDPSYLKWLHGQDLTRFPQLKAYLDKRFP